MILAITHASDPTANAVLAGLNQLGVPWARFNQAGFPESVQLTFEPSGAAPAILVDEDGDEIDLLRIRTTWIWHPMPFDLPADLDGPEAGFVHEACHATTQLLMEILRERTYMVTPPGVERRAADKGLQLRLARNLGLTIPHTLITNSPGRARAFCAEHKEVIFKLLHRPWMITRDGTRWVFSNLLGGEDLEALDDLRHCPGIFQKRIPKRFDLRVTVVGDRIFPVEIHSQSTSRGRVDFRLALGDELQDMPHVVHHLPPPLEERILALAKALGLKYCAMDFIVTPQGDYVFLEVNPSGQFTWIEAMTGLPITRTLVHLLVERPE